MSVLEHVGSTPPEAVSYGGFCATHLMQFPCAHCAGYCSLHNHSTPCPSCTSAPVLPTVYPEGLPLYPLADPLPPLQTYQVPAVRFGYSFLPKDCDHCFCERHPARVYGGVKAGIDSFDHDGCCNCGIRRLSQT
jgi:hypothetical protein